MSISKTTRKAGPFTGNGIAFEYTFDFKVFKKEDILIVIEDKDEVETYLSEDKYTINLSKEKDAIGGKVILKNPLADRFKLSILSDMPNTQPVEISNKGGFFPSTLNDSFDRATIQIQQLAEKVNRSIKLDVNGQETPKELLEKIFNTKNQVKDGLAKLENELTATNEKLKTDEAKLDILGGLISTKFSKAESDLRDLKKVLKEMRTTLEADINTEKGELDTLQTTVQHLIDRLKTGVDGHLVEIEKIEAELKKVQTAVNNDKDEVLRGVGQIEALLQEVNAAKKQIDDLKNELAAAGKLKEDVQHLIETGFTEKVVQVNRIINEFLPKASSTLSAISDLRTFVDQSRRVIGAAKLAVGTSTGIVVQAQKKVESDLAKVTTASVQVTTLSGQVVADREVVKLAKDELEKVWLGSYANPPTTMKDGTPLVPGVMYYDQTLDTMYYYGESKVWLHWGYLHAETDPQGDELVGPINYYVFDISSNTKTVTGVSKDGRTLDYDIKSPLILLVNGVIQLESTYTASDGTSIVLTGDLFLQAGDTVTAIVFGPFGIKSLSGKKLSKNSITNFNPFSSKMKTFLAGAFTKGIKNYRKGQSVTYKGIRYIALEDLSKSSVPGITGSESAWATEVDHLQMELRHYYSRVWNTHGYYLPGDLVTFNRDLYINTSDKVSYNDKPTTPAGKEWVDYHSYVFNKVYPAGSIFIQKDIQGSVRPEIPKGHKPSVKWESKLRWKPDGTSKETYIIYALE